MKLPMYTDPDGIDLDASQVSQSTWLTSFMFMQHFDLMNSDFELKRRTYNIPCGDGHCNYDHHYVFWDLYAHGERVTSILALIVNSLKASALKEAYKSKVEAIEAAKKDNNPGLAVLMDMAEIPRGDFDYVVFEKEYAKWLSDPEEQAMKS